ncbi:MAG: hypothetical protein A2804_02830 [Candidatus Pacebacteria bacterium RIFCSPHIGHO2_01_FULL_46_10]|nr:MAG: hypothetical protein A2804_02830 [Candidatus Pacebacteria bacterium RIFCSPHIGHO2_01_FULL_46_10]
MTWFFFALASAVFAALTSIFAKIGMKGVDSNLATFIRILFILPFTLLIVFAQGNLKDAGKFSTLTWVFLGLSGIATGLSWLFYFRALQIGDVHKVVPIDKLSFIFAIVLGVLLFKEKISQLGVLGIFFLLLGTYLVVLK